MFTMYEHCAESFPQFIPQMKSLELRQTLVTWPVARGQGTMGLNPGCLMPKAVCVPNHCSALPLGHRLGQALGHEPSLKSALGYIISPS